MLQAAQISLGRQLLDYIDTRSTAMAPELYLQAVDDYTSAATASLEQAKLFRALPMCVGMSGLLPRPGSFQTHDVSGLPLLLTRNEQGRVQAFLNVCRHRGARVADGCGKTRALVCPYHAWSYDLNGQLKVRPADSAFDGAPHAGLGLTPLATEERDGLIWVMPRAQATLDLDAHLGALNDELASFALSGFHHYETRTLTRRMNWKLLLDTFLESYHFCVLHRDSICAIFHDNLGAFDHWGPHFRLVSPRKSIEQIRGEQASSWNLLPHIVSIYVLFPNTVLVWQLDHVELWQIHPGASADESITLLSLYTPEPAHSEAARRHWDKNMDLVVHVVEKEDFPIGEGIQHGFHSGAQSSILFGRNEPGLIHFHRSVSAALGA
ncbi:MAG: Rieske 2Fe-2S domain-containing protein [Proteobacteria bacterium]|nr:Rieske 2Fe-2S domain-containing protein [Pseudomonadota bacterium]